MPIRSILFDAGFTLVFPDWRAVLEPLEQRGLRPTAEHLGNADRHVRRVLDQRDLRSFAASVDRIYWEEFVAHLLAALPGHARDLLPDLVAAARRSSNWTQVMPGTVEVLRTLRNRYQLGVVSNSDGSVASVLERAGLAKFFDCIIDSGVAGVQKPDPAIFGLAARSLGALPGNCLYVGDTYSVDYLGATLAGMQAVLMDRSGSYADSQLPRIASLEELPGWLAQASLVEQEGEGQAFPHPAAGPE